MNEHTQANTYCSIEMCAVFFCVIYSASWENKIKADYSKKPTIIYDSITHQDFTISYGNTCNNTEIAIPFSVEPHAGSKTFWIKRF
jgi:hypothetical protein